MDYEKKYKELLEKAKDFNFQGYIDEECLYDMFPELKLKESKDERIRKRLIDFFEDWHKNRSHCWGIAVTDILTWLEKQGELPEGCVRKQVAEAKEALYYAPCADTINGQGITNQVSQSEVTKISDKGWSEEDEEELGIAIKYLQRAGQWDSATWLKSLKTRLKGE